MAMNYVYLMQHENNGPVKIGFSKNVFLRWVNLNDNSPIQLKFIMAIKAGSVTKAKEIEAGLIKKLWRDRIRGEWFQNTCLGYAKMLFLELGTPIKSLEFWEPGLYDRASKLHWMDGQELHFVTNESLCRLQPLRKPDEPQKKLL
jgi:hypothetical protein